MKSKRTGLGAAAGAAMFLTWAAWLGLSQAGAADLDPKQLSRELDRLYRSESSQGLVVMKVKTAHYQRELKMKIWTKGLDYTLVRILTPRKEKGTATLKRKNEMWNYLPKIGKTIRIPPSMMMNSWMGSDFTNDDLVKETSWEEDYNVSLNPAPPPGQIGLVYVPKEDAAVTWSKVVTFLDEKSRLPVSQEYCDEKGVKVRVMDVSQVRNLGGRTLPAKMVLTPLTEDKKGNRTELIYQELEFDVELEDDLFSLSNLRRGR
ncbi:MAG: outer membrane lipoprotein-sorting protein [Deltaproteobacteria bacterium]|nr:outer membrane lipoprotein-sorting protein [Deltaproteobacteria bacterium]